MRALFLGLVAATGLLSACDDDFDDDVDIVFFDIRFVATGYGEGVHAGQLLYFGLDSEGDFRDIGSIEVPEDGDFDVTFVDALAEDVADATFYWWADVDGDQECDGPASELDHAWSKSRDTEPDGTWLIEHIHATDFDLEACDQPWL